MFSNTSFIILDIVTNVWCVDDNNGPNNANASKKSKRNSLASPSVQRKAFVKAPPNSTSPKVFKPISTHTYKTSRNNYTNISCAAIPDLHYCILLPSYSISRGLDKQHKLILLSVARKEDIHHMETIHLKRKLAKDCSIHMEHQQQPQACFKLMTNKKL